MKASDHMLMFIRLIAAVAVFWLPMAGYEQFLERVLGIAASPCFNIAISILLMAFSAIKYVRFLKRTSRHPARDFLIDLALYFAAAGLGIWLVFGVADVLGAQLGGSEMNGLEYYFYAPVFLLPPVMAVAALIIGGIRGDKTNDPADSSGSQDKAFGS